MLSANLSPTTTAKILEDGANLESTIKDATVTLQVNGGAVAAVPYVDSFGYLLLGNSLGPSRMRSKSATP
jgi:hypothetical protein